MRRRLIILGVLAGVAVLAVIIVLVSRGGIGTQTTACQDMIIGLRNGDATSTYNLLSESARTVTTPEQWQSQTDLYKSLFEGGTQTPWFISSETQEGTEDNPGTVTTDRYRFDSTAGEWDGICTMYESDAGLISSFQPVTAGYDE